MKRIQIFYQNQKAGELAAAGHRTSFQFDPAFIRSGIQLSPLTMPLREEPYVYSDEEFGFLPPLLSDSLPDSYGRSVMNRWFSQKFGADYRPSVLEKLAYVGDGGIGALAYQPVLESFPVEILRKLATSLVGHQPLEILDKLRRVAHTVGGRFPKALVAVDPVTGLHFEEDARLSPHFEHWLVKFGTPSKDRDTLLNYPQVEYAYSNMARDVGIQMPRTRLITTPAPEEQEGELVHFAIERFERDRSTRRHVASLSALTAIPAGRLELDYRDLFSTTLELCRDLRELRQAFLRMIFNVVMHNVDDHGKNHAFIFNGTDWKLSPAYDVTFSDVSAPGQHTVAARAMPVNGNPINPKRRDFLKMGERFGLKRTDCLEQIDRVAEGAAHIERYLNDSGVPRAHVAAIVKTVEKTAKESLR